MEKLLGDWWNMYKKKNCKTYIRKWSDIINCELRPQYEYLKEKLKLKQRDPSEETQEEIVSRHK